MTNNTYTIFAKWPNDEEGIKSHPGAVYAVIEEIDIVASSADEARAGAIKDLTEGYMPGWEIIEVRQQQGLFW